MITHIVRHNNKCITKPGEHKKVYVCYALSDIKKRDLLISFKQRWEFYTNNTFDFIYIDKDLESYSSNDFIENITNCLKNCDGMMALISNNIKEDYLFEQELSIAIESNIQMVGIDIRKKDEGFIPDILQDKMIKWGWEWFSEFIDSL